MNLGRAIAELRKQKKMKQKELAIKCNISVPTLCNIEKGKCMPSYKTVEALADGLDVSQGYLILSALDDEDVKPEKLHLFKAMKDVLIFQN